MRIVESRSIDNQAGLLGSRLITGTNAIEGAFQSFIVAEDTVVTKVYNSIGIDVTGKLGLTSITLKAGAFISMPRGDYFSSIKLTSGSIVAYFTSHGGKTITADAYLNEFLARTGSSYLEASECVKAHLQQLINAGLLQKASLIMSPSMYEKDLVKSAVPQDGSGDLSFTRASNGTRINSAGLVEVCPWNLVTYSNDFSSSWALIESSKSTGVTDPIGNSNAIKLKYTTATSGHYITQGITLAGSNAHSVYAKAGELQFLQIASAQSIDEYVNFNLSTGVIGTYGSRASNVQIENVGNGWYRCSVVFTSGSNGIYLAIVQSASSDWFGVSTYAGANATDGLYLYGGQVNTGTLKPYFPTTDRLNVPRLTYQNGGGGCPSLLLEKQSTNYVKYSEDFTQSAWQKSGATITANSIISPDGTQNATRVEFSAGSRYVYQSLGGSGIPAGSVTISCYIKGASVQKIGFSDGNANPNEITLTTDWQRYTFTFIYSSGGIGIQFDNYFGVTPSQETKDFYIWGAQVEASSYPTSYIQTTSSSATRVADDCQKTSISSLIGQTEGTLFCQYNLPYTTNDTRIMAISGGSDRVAIFCDYTSIGFLVVTSAGLVILESTTYTPQASNKVALAYKSGLCSLYLNGTQILSSTTTFSLSATIANLYLGQYEFSPGTGQNGLRVEESVIFKTRLTNAELASLTTI